jgi:hypothetical protein
LQAAAIAFLASVSSVVEDRGKRNVLLLTLTVPSVMYVTLACYKAQAQWAYLLCLAACFSGGVVCFVWVNRRSFSDLVSVVLLCAGVGGWAAWATLRGSFDQGTAALLAIGFALPGVFCWRSHRRPSPAIITISVGFLCWGAAFPVKMLLDRAAPHIIFPAELLNVPKIFVALGMILANASQRSLPACSTVPE